MPRVTFQNADGLTPEVLRNTMVETVDQMERIEVGDGNGYASAMSVFPMVDMNNPTEGYYTFGGSRGAMSAAAPDAESPIARLTLPSKRDFTTHSYKEKVNPRKDVETELDSTPFSLFAYGASYLQLGIFLTREIVAWRGDEYIDGLIGPNGATAHPDVEYVETPATAWSDTVNSDPYGLVVNVAHDVKTGGRLMNGQPQPTMFAPPSVIRDLRLNDSLRAKVGDNRDQTLNVGDVSNLMSDEVAGVREVAVQVPRTNADGEFIDDTGTVVTDADDAVTDNILEPYDPGTATTNRNVVIGRTGANSAFMPWFLEKLTTRAEGAPDTSSLSIDNQRGFFTQMWNDNDPIATWMKAGQDLGFHIREPENWAVVQGV